VIRMHDGFAGAGGSSTGATQVDGVEVVVAMNHWQQAVDVHNANHPNTEHVCADISQYDPKRIPTAELGWWSPECTNHSKAKGKKRVSADPDFFGEILPDEAAERSRATMWDVVRFTEYHRYQAVIVENVVEARQWEPFKAWLLAMDSYGYDRQIVYLNSMHAQARGLPAPQSRDRIYVVFWRKGNKKPDLERMQRPRAYCPGCDQVVDAMQSWKKPDAPWGRYRSQYVYRCPKVACRNQIVEPGWLPAAAAIDFSILGTRIGDRDGLGMKDLSEKTRLRIAAGIAKRWGPLHIEAAGHTYDAADPKHKSHRDPNGYYRAWSTEDALKTLHTIESKALVVPVEGREGKEARPTGLPLRTQTTRHENALAMPSLMVQLNGTTEGHLMRSAYPVTDPARTLTAEGNNDYLLTSYYGNSKGARPVVDPMGALTTRDRHALIMRNNNNRGDDQSSMTTPIHEALRTLTTGGHQSVITPGDLAAAEAQVDDCLFRMLEPHEVAAGMAFPKDYIWEGTRRERVKMAGNAVTPPAARDLVACVVESLEGAA
jgi:DNA (cytosine-5)-methyltransferase 1